MTISEAMAYIHATEWQGSRPGLSRITELLAAIGNPERSLRCIHIAGTNGKGSTSAMLDAILRRAGYRVALFTSPYLYRFGERMQMMGEPIPDAALCRVIERIRRETLLSLLRNYIDLQHSSFVKTVFSVKDLIEQLYLIKLELGHISYPTHIDAKYRNSRRRCAPCGFKHISVAADDYHKISLVVYCLGSLVRKYLSVSAAAHYLILVRDGYKYIFASRLYFIYHAHSRRKFICYVKIGYKRYCLHKYPFGIKARLCALCPYPRRYILYISF